MASGIIKSGVTPIEEGGTGASSLKEALENIMALPAYALEANNENLDTMMKTRCNARVRSSVNAGLYSALGYSSNGFALVYQVFYTVDETTISADSMRVQIAFPYSASCSKFAWRNYNGGWSNWHAIS